MLKNDDVDITMYGIAVVMKPTDSPISLDAKELENVLTPPLMVARSTSGQTLISSGRDQIEAIASPEAVNVRNLSGKRDFENSKVPDVLRFFAERLGQAVTAYGVNFLLKVPCSNPDQWIGDNILSSSIAKKTGQKIAGGPVALKTKAGPKVWTIKLEPTSDNRMIVDLNAHQDTEKLPDKEVLRGELTEQYAGLLVFLHQIGL